ncbi:hypothetical protein GCM10017562_59970 [Streptomyces roseofulvus]|uniref:hypothetical protein n=1 Tax=Streptomyces roseofulvus TaxID=33902 RepID=UPI0031FD57AA
MNNTDTDTDTRVWAFANTGRLMHAFTRPWVDAEGNTSAQHLRAECRGTIARHKDSLFVSAASAVPRCKSCEAKWNGYLARLEASMAPVNPYDQVCEGIEPEVVVPEEIATAGRELFTRTLERVRRDRRDRHTARRVLADRRRTNRAAARCARRPQTVVTHLIATGLAPKAARSAGGTLRKCADRIVTAGTLGVSYAKRVPARPCVRYTRAEIALAAAQYKPRKPEYKAARLALVGGAR